MTLYLLTAPSGAGKTTFCGAVVQAARAVGWTTAGVLCPPVFEHDNKTGILVQNLRTDETRPLALLATLQVDPATFTAPLGRWLFAPSALAWGNEMLADSRPTDLLIVDELGPLELLHGAGWQNALTTLHQATYRLGIAVVRPSLIEAAQRVFPEANVLPLLPNADPQQILGEK